MGLKHCLLVLVFSIASSPIVQAVSEDVRNLLEAQFYFMYCLFENERGRERERERLRAFTKKESVGREIKEKRKQNSF